MGLIIPPYIAETMKLSAEDYEARITRDFETIEPWLPAKVSSVLDIGCGLAGVNVLIANWCSGACKKINLLDGDGTAHRKVGFVANTKAWSDVNRGAEVVRANLPGTVKVAAFTTAEKKIPCDLLISLKSWAHHYSAQTYMALAVASLRKKGRMILDIRTGTDGLKAFEAAGFKSIAVCHETAKAKRHVFEWT